VRELPVHVKIARGLPTDSRYAPSIRRECLMRRTVCFASLATVAFSAFAAATDNGGNAWWPQFRGPNSSGIGEGKPPVQFGPGKNVIWKGPVGPGLSSPIVWKERIFLTEYDRDKKQFTTLCIDRRTGKTLWRRTVSAPEIEKVHEVSSPAGSTPVTDGERI